MRSLLVAAVLASSSIASAGTYLGIGIGTGPSIGNNAIPNPEANGRSGRLLLGESFGHLAVELEANRFGLSLNGSGYDSTMLGIGLKYGVPLADGFELFGRGGFQRTWLSGGGESAYYDGAGFGYYLGAGVEYRFLGLASVFVDYEWQSATIDESATDGTSFGQSAGMFTLGATIQL
jgi:hypothetical protein